MKKKYTGFFVEKTRKTQCQKESRKKLSEQKESRKKPSEQKEYSQVDSLSIEQ